MQAPFPVFSSFGWNHPQAEVISTGLINTTWKVRVDRDCFLLQKINTSIFKVPDAIDANLEMLDAYLQEHAPAYLFTAPVKTPGGTGLIWWEGEAYRAFKWVPGSHTVTVAADAGQAREAAAQFGKFTATLRDFDARKLRITLPDFHNLELRNRQFEQAIKNGNPARIEESRELITYLRSQDQIVQRYKDFIANPEAKLRVTHHDTKISNVLLDENNRGLCVIDLDTVMPGYFLSDVGDMYRTYVCPVSEEEAHLDKIILRKEFMDAIREGYLSWMKPVLSNFELDHFNYAGQMMTYMQAIRFLADYLNDDVYYGSRYPGQNLVRAANQGRLLELLVE